MRLIFPISNICTFYFSPLLSSSVSVPVLILSIIFFSSLTLYYHPHASYFSHSTICTFYFLLNLSFSSLAFVPLIFPLFAPSHFILSVMHFIFPLGTICNSYFSPKLFIILLSFVPFISSRNPSLSTICTFYFSP